jgi:hypothetical protein
LHNLTYTVCALAFGFALAAPASAYAHGQSRPVYGHAHHATQAEISPKATALAPAWTMSPAGVVTETDGLSRNLDDCNHGCIDN